MHDFLFTKNNDQKKYIHPLSLQTSGGVPQVSRHLFTAKPAFIQQRFADLDVFRQQIEESKAGLHHQPYTMNKKNTNFYKMVFLGFASLFFILSVTAMAIPTALGCGFLFSSCSKLKMGIVTVCTVLSLLALTMGLRLRAEKEAVILGVRKTKAHIATIYARKKIRLGIKSFFSLFGPERQKAVALKHMYHELCDKINNKKDEAFHLVNRIATAETLDAQEKEDLLNQAIEEFNHKLHVLTNNFRHAIVK